MVSDPFVVCFLENEATEPTAELLLDTRIQRLGEHKKECVLAIAICIVAFLCDLTRWILILVFGDGMTPFYLTVPQMIKPCVLSLVDDGASFAAFTLLYYVHRQWIQLAEYQRWSRFYILYVACTTRVFMWIPMIWGNGEASIHLLRFIFLFQTVYYFAVTFSWIPVLQAYQLGLVYQRLPPSEAAAETMVVDVKPAKSVAESVAQPVIVPKFTITNVDDQGAMTVEERKQAASPNSSPDSQDESQQLLPSGISSGVAAFLPRASVSASTSSFHSATS